MLGAFASSIGLQAVIGGIARSGDSEFDARQSLTAIAQLVLDHTGARGVTIEHARDAGAAEIAASVGQPTGPVRRLPIVCEQNEVGWLAIYGAPMFGPATADRTHVLVDVAGIVIMRAASIAERSRPAIEDARFRLINGVSHNLRNTLGAASGYMQLVQLDAALNDLQSEYVDRGRRAINAAIELIGDLLAVTRADAGKLLFDYEAVNVNEVARAVVRNHRRGAHNWQCSVELVTAHQDPMVLSDVAHLQQLLDVLVYNAVRYSPPDGRVTVRVETRDGRRASDPTTWVCVSVMDTGGGVADAQHVFEEVHRVERGIGNVRFKLAICRRVARLLGGDLTLNTEKAVGSTFTLWLPAPERARSLAHAQPAAISAI